jgi:chaperone BCS1
MTTNHKEKLDPALIRPGRADLHFEYGHANKTMLSRLFTLFYPAKEDSITADPIEGQVSSQWDGSEKPLDVSDNSELDTLRWDKHEVEKWRALWVKYIPEGRFSIAQLQGEGRVCLVLKQIRKGH